jgi:hypothetical protein
VRARDAFTQAQLRLQAAGCRYRIKEVARSPYVQVYETLPSRRQQSAPGLPVRRRGGLLGSGGPAAAG